MNKADTHRLYMASNYAMAEIFSSNNYIYLTTKSITYIHLLGFTYIIGNRMLGQVKKRYLNYLQCSTYIRINNVTIPILI